MIYAIIAAGEGSRLAEEGYPFPKPMVRLQGDLLIDRLIGIFARHHAEAIYIIINEESPELEAHLSSAPYHVPVHVLRKSTASSLHSLHELLSHYSGWEACCITTIDTVFDENEFGDYINTFIHHESLDGLMAVTAFVDDESPLYVSVDEENNITAFTDQAAIRSAYVSGGVYCLRKKALSCVEDSINNDRVRMRNFQRDLLLRQLAIKAYPFQKIIDIDHVRDIGIAEEFLKASAGNTLV